MSPQQTPPTTTDFYNRLEQISRTGHMNLYMKNNPRHGRIDILGEDDITELVALPTPKHSELHAKVAEALGLASTSHIPLEWQSYHAAWTRGQGVAFGNESGVPYIQVGAFKRPVTTSFQEAFIAGHERLSKGLSIIDPAEATADTVTYQLNKAALDSVAHIPGN